MKARRMQLVSTILDVVTLLSFFIEFIFPELTWMRICTLSLLIVDVILSFWQIRESKHSGEDVDTKKLVIGIVLGVVLTLVAVWIMLIKVLNTGLE